MTDGFNLTLVYLWKDCLQAGVFTLVFNDWYAQLKGRHNKYLLSRKKGWLCSSQMIRMSNDGVLGWEWPSVRLPRSLICQPIQNSAMGDHWLADLSQLIKKQQKASLSAKALSLHWPVKAMQRTLVTKLWNHQSEKSNQAQASKIWQLDSTNLTSLLFTILLVIQSGMEYKYHIKNSEKQKMSMFFSVLQSLPCPESSLKFTMESWGLRAEKPPCPHGGWMDPEDVTLVKQISPRRTATARFLLKEASEIVNGRAPGGSESKEFACSGSLISGSGRSPGEGNGYPLKYSCLEYSMNRGAWRATIHGVATEQLTLSLSSFHSNQQQKGGDEGAGGCCPVGTDLQ